MMFAIGQINRGQFFLKLVQSFLKLHRQFLWSIVMYRLETILPPILVPIIFSPWWMTSAMQLGCT